jgi:hypothetical protein
LTSTLPATVLGGVGAITVGLVWMKLPSLRRVEVE